MPTESIHSNNSDHVDIKPLTMAIDPKGYGCFEKHVNTIVTRVICKPLIIYINKT